MNHRATLLIVFGATGDLAMRMLWPSLYFLEKENLLNANLQIVAAGRNQDQHDVYRQSLLHKLSEQIPCAFWELEAAQRLMGRLTYVSCDAAKPESFAPLSALSHTNKGIAVSYLSTPPSLYGSIAKALEQAGLAREGDRIVLEKPIGHDLISSQAINEEIGAIFSERQIFRVDHYLGKETVQNLLALRFGNAIFEPLWTSDTIDHIQITVAETVGLEGRAAYYNHYGALRDMVQNHLLQLVALIAMEPPSTFDDGSVRNEKVKVLKSLRRMTAQTIDRLIVTGQYQIGAIHGERAAGYGDELGAPSDTETFVAIRADVDNWRWAGVPFYLRTGKRLPVRQSEIVVQFKPVPHSIFASQGAVLHPNKLILRLQPEEDIRLLLMAKEPSLASDQARFRELPLNLSLNSAFGGLRRRIAYERLLLDALKGDPTLFVRRDEVDAAWSWIDGITSNLASAHIMPRPYASGTWGPAAAMALPERFGHSWHD